MKKLILSACIFIGCSTVSAAPMVAGSPELSVSRYVSVKPSIKQAQINPMLALIPRHYFGPDVITLRDAFESLLDNSGYAISTYHPDKRIIKMFALPLPQVQRSLESISLQDAIKTLAGESWEMVLDPINRLITFQLPDTPLDAPLVYIAKPKTIEERKKEKAAVLQAAVNAEIQKRIKAARAKQFEAQRLANIARVKREREAQALAAKRAQEAARARYEASLKYSAARLSAKLEKKEKLFATDLPEILRGGQ